MTDPTNTARQARFRKMRALGYEHVEGWLPPKRAAKVRQWIADARKIEDWCLEAKTEELTEHISPITGVVTKYRYDGGAAGEKRGRR